MLLERQIEQTVVKHAIRRGLLVTKLNLMGRRGMPDRCFWLKGGKPLLIEFKRPGGKTTKLQEHTIARLRKLKYNVHIVEDIQTGKNLIDWFAGHRIKALDAGSAS